MIHSQVRFSFLTAGPGYEADIPSEYNNPPELVAPLDVTGTGEGRNYDFIPSVRDVGMLEEASTYLTTLETVSGFPLELWQQKRGPEEERLWELRWVLDNGAIYSHLREEDGIDQASLLASSLEIEISPIGLPMLLPVPPVRRMASFRPGYQEVATFPSSEDDGAIQFWRPSHLGANRELVDPTIADGDGVKLRIGTSQEVEIRVLSRKPEGEVADAARAIAASLSIR